MINSFITTIANYRDRLAYERLQGRDLSFTESLLLTVCNKILKEALPKPEPLPPEVKKVIEDVKKMRADMDAPHIFLGKIIEDGALRCEVTAFLGDEVEDFYGHNLHIKVLEIGWDRLGTYLDIGKSYPLTVVYRSKNQDMIVWEVDPDTMKRSTSQVLLAWEKGVGWAWDLDM